MTTVASIASDFGGASVDRRVGDALLEVISPLGLAASLRAIAELTTGEAAQRTALANQLAQCAYEAQKAFEQCSTVDARNRLAAAELERRWNEKLEACEAIRARLSRLEDTRSVLSSEDHASIRPPELVGGHRRCASAATLGKKAPWHSQCECDTFYEGVRPCVILCLVPARPLCDVPFVPW
ncbi:hypothetical protein BH24ACI4_BH24ACI4_09490 [soil metagenome]